MPRDGAIIFADLIGKLDVLYVHCGKCSRAGRYRVQNLIGERGSNGKLIDWLDEITADCPKKLAHNMDDPCGARFPDLAEGAVAHFHVRSTRGHVQCTSSCLLWANSGHSLGQRHRWCEPTRHDLSSRADDERTAIPRR
jgi:hypothetical protein